MKPTRPSGAAWSVAAVVGLAALLRFWQLGTESLWVDEVTTVYFSRGSLVEYLKWMVVFDTHPPLHYFATMLWGRVFGWSEFAVRSLSAVAGTLMVYAMYRLGRRLWGHGTGLVAALLLALSGFHVFHSQDARAYVFLALFSLLSMEAYLGVLALPRGAPSASGATAQQRHAPSQAATGTGDMARDTASDKASGEARAARRAVRRAVGLYLLWTGLMLYSHAYALFLVAAQGTHALWLLWRDRRASQSASATSSNEGGPPAGAAIGPLAGPPVGPPPRRVWGTVGLLALIYLPAAALVAIHAVAGRGDQLAIPRPSLLKLAVAPYLYFEPQFVEEPDWLILAVGTLFLALAAWGVWTALDATRRARAAAGDARNAPSGNDRANPRVSAAGEGIVGEVPALRHLLVLWLALPVLIPWFEGQVATPIWAHRATVAASLALFLLAARGLWTLRPAFSGVGTAAACVGLALLLVPYYSEPQKAQWRETVDYVEGEASSADLVLTLSPRPYDYYRSRADLAVEAYQVPANETDTDARLHDLTDDYRRVWVVIPDIERAGLIRARTAALAYFEEHYRLDDVKSQCKDGSEWRLVAPTCFVSIEVREYVRR